MKAVTIMYREIVKNNLNCIFVIWSLFSVYYYHEVLQLFKKECYDMVVMQSEKVDGDKYLMSMQSEDKQGVSSPDGTLRVKVRL